MARDRRVMVQLSAEELGDLDRRRGGLSRAAFVRSALLSEEAGADPVASRDEALGILSRMARDGKVAAAIALEKALRCPVGDENDDEQGKPQDWFDELGARRGRVA